MATRTTLSFQTFYNNCKFFYDKKNTELELGVIQKTLFGVSASIFLGNGAWSQVIPVGDFTYTKDCEAFLRKLFADKQALVEVIENYRAEQNAKLDALTTRLTH